MISANGNQMLQIYATRKNEGQYHCKSLGSFETSTHMKLLLPTHKSSFCGFLLEDKQAIVDF